MSKYYTYTCICPKCKCEHEKSLFLFNTSPDTVVRYYCDKCRKISSNISENYYNDISCEQNKKRYDRKSF